MAPTKSSRNNDEAKAEGGNTKEKNGGQHTSTKMRRVASQTNNAQAREAASAPTSAPVQPPVEPVAPSINWPAFDRNVLHAYSREHRLNTATSFTCSYHECLLTQPGGIGMYSPTMARKKRHARRQSKDSLARAVRKHFNGIGIQENDVIVDFIYKIKVDNASKATGPNSQVIFSTEA